MAPAKQPKQSTNHDPSVIARIGAHALHAKYDARETTKAGRTEFLKRFEKEVDPEGVLEPRERKTRAEHARKAYFTKLGRKSGLARRRAA
jgi:hypothetical protein